MAVVCEHADSFHRYGSDEPTPERAMIADDVLKALEVCRHNIPCDGRH